MKRIGLKLEGRRGSYMAEAAVVLPLVILAVITVVLILMFFYEESVCQSRLHVELRQKAALETGRAPDGTAGAGDVTTGADGTGSATAGAGGVTAGAGKSGGVTDNTGGSSAVIEVSRDGLFKNISGYAYVRMVSRGLLSSLKESKVEGSWHGADGVAFKRLFD